MNIVEKFKQFKELKSKRKESGVDIIYDLIMEEFERYEDELKEIKNLKQTTGHDHFRTKEVTEKVLNLIELNDDVLTVQDSLSGFNIGMKAAVLGLEDIVIRALDNMEA